MRWSGPALLPLLLAGCTLAGPTGSGIPPAWEPPPPERGAEPEAGAPDAETPVRWERAPLPPPVTSPFPEVRGLWVVRFSLASPESVREVVRRAHGAGFNTLLVQVRGRGDAWFRGGVEPVAEALWGAPPGFDPLDLLIREAHARGIQVHAWMNTHLVAGVGPLPSDPEHVVHAHPEWLGVPEELARELFDARPDRRYAERLRAWAAERTDRVEGIYTSPANPRVQEHLYRVWMDVVERYPVDGVHFDYVRYPSGEFDYSRGSLEAFREWLAGRIPEETRSDLETRYRSDPLALPAGAPREWAEFRREQITRLVERIVRGAKARRPGLMVSAAVFPDVRDAREHRFQDWRHWLEEGLIDVAVPMAYTPRDNRFRALVSEAVRGVDGDRVWAGIGVYRTTFEGTLRKARIARELDAGGFVLFSYDWMVGEGESRTGIPLLERVGRALF